MNKSLLPYRVITSFLSSLLFLISFSLLAQNTIPEPLKPWVPWVSKGSEALTCPYINNTQYENQQNHVCAWPSDLALKVTDNSAVFIQSWHILTKSIIPLPGSTKNWPSVVKVNSKQVPVISHKGVPSIELTKGNYQIEGSFEWQKIPESLAIPAQYAFVKLTVNDQVSAFPKIENNDLWLQKSESKQTKQDTLDISVARRITDGTYIALETFISLNVSGKMREVKLGKLLPSGFELISIESQLSSFIDGDGVLRAKVKPGSYSIQVQAYAQPTLLSWSRPERTHNWPKDEIWVFQGHEKLRLGKIEGAKMIDSSQATMPKAWYELPSYLMSTNDTLKYDIQHRGKPLHLENQLSLNRTLWFSFDNHSYTFNDDINGTMINDWRLSMTSPYSLESAEDKDGSVLITTTTENERGIEYRYPHVNIQARGVISAEKTLPVTGWDSNFERVSVLLQLPPGNKLFAVFGADYVSDSWWASWTIWSSFIVLLSSLITGRLISKSAGVFTALMLVVIYQVSGAPIAAIVNLLIAIAIKKHQPFDCIKPVVNLYWGASITVAIGAILFFSASQIRTVIYPQLEARQSSVESFNAAPAMLVDSASKQAVKRKESALYSTMESSANAIMDRDRMELIKVSGSKANAKNLMMERYQSDSLMQAGSGIPNWQWNSYRIQWNSPVAKDQLFDVIVLSKSLYRIIKLIGVALTLLWLYILLKDAMSFVFTQFTKKVNAKGLVNNKAIVSIIAVFLFFPSYVPNTQATDFPDQTLLNELKARVTEVPLCAPNCASINTMQVSINTKQLTLILSVHANVDTALAIPRSEFWRPEKLNVSQNLNKTSIDSLYKNKGWIYIPVAKGISTITLIGQIAPVDTFQLEFKEKPKHLNLKTNDAWEIVGTQNNRLAGNALEFIATINVISSNTTTNTDNNTDLTSTRYSAHPFVKVTRTLSIDQLFTVQTKVERIAPSSGAINIKVPILTGENITTAGVVAENNQVQVTIPAGSHAFTWRSNITKQAAFSLYAQPELSLIEYWQVIVSPAWHAKLTGLPIILEDQNNSDYYTYSFYPHPDERLNIAVTRPESVKGDVLAIDSVNYKIDQGTRTSKLMLSFEYRSTRGGEHNIELPESYQLKEIRTDNKLINLQVENGKLAVPVLPGKHSVNIVMRANVSDALFMSAPTINLNAPVSNITSIIDLNSQRWILWAKGPLLGPAVLYWGELFAFILLALLVSKVKFSPLSTFHWIVLGFGLSLSNWGVLMLIAFWFASITASNYRPKTISRLVFNSSQFLLYVLSIITIMSLVSVVPVSLLSSPSMGIEGNYSYGNHLQWFSDKTDGLLPQVSVMSIPILFYKGIMLAWVIWLSFAFLNWIKWAWKTLGEQGYWRSKLSKQLEQK